MWKTVVREGEEPAALAARLNRPLCMILRNNGLYSAAWLLPGREIEIREEGDCEEYGNLCPALAMRLPALERVWITVKRGDDFLSLSRVLSLPVRAVMAHAGVRSVSEALGRAICFPKADPGARIHTVLPGETLSDFAGAQDEMLLRAVNALWGPVYPGMRILIPTIT